MFDFLGAGIFIVLALEEIEVSRNSSSPLMLRSLLKFFFTAVLIFLPGLHVTSAQHAAKLQKNEDEKRSDLPFRVYAQWAIDSFDANKDGSLTKEEMKEMQSPLLEEWYDINKNGKLSFDEIVEAIRRPSSAKVEEKPGSEPAISRLDPKLVKYAQALVNQYDMDDDKSLSLDEAQKMRRPVPDSADKNQDGKFSLFEIASSLATPVPANAIAKPAVVVKGDLNIEVEALAKRFYEASLKTNDKNGDGKLDSSEIANAKWSTIRWQESDTNNDGLLSSDELQVRYQQMFIKLLSKRGEANTPANQHAQAWPAMQGQIRQPPRSKNRRPVGGTLLGGAIGNSGDILGGLLGGTAHSPSTRSSSKRNPEIEATFVNVELYLLRLPINSDSARLANAVKTLNESDEPTSDAVKGLAKQLGITSYDQLMTSALEGRAAKVQSGASIPRITGATQTTRGRTFNQSFVEVGLRAEVTPELNDNGIILAIDLEKSDLIVTEDKDKDKEIPESLIVTWTYDSAVQIKQGKPAVIGSSSSNQHWILVVDASRVK